MAVPSASNQLDDLILEGNFTFSKPVQFLIEIDDDNSTTSRYRWSMDGGLTFVDEYIEITAGVSQPLRHGLSIKFPTATGYGLGDRWSFTARPMHQIVKLENIGTSSIDIQLTRNNLKDAIDHATSNELLSIRTFTNSSSEKLFLAHTYDRLISQNVDIYGSALPSIAYTDNDLDGDNEPDNFILSQSMDPIHDQPFGVTWEANTTGTFVVFAIAEDSSGNRANSTSTVITVISSVGEVPVIELGTVEQSMV